MVWLGYSTRKSNFFFFLSWHNCEAYHEYQRKINNRMSKKERKSWLFFFYFFMWIVETFVFKTWIYVLKSWISSKKLTPCGRLTTPLGFPKIDSRWSSNRLRFNSLPSLKHKRFNSLWSLNHSVRFIADTTLGCSRKSVAATQMIIRRFL